MIRTKSTGRLTLTELSENLSEFWIVTCYHDGLSMTENRIDIANHYFGYVRYLIEDRVSVRANQTGNVHVFAIDA
jgi:hypothetical protein